jgi:hypothetical protein
MNWNSRISRTISSVLSVLLFHPKDDGIMPSLECLVMFVRRQKHLGDDSELVQNVVCRITVS